MRIPVEQLGVARALAARASADVRTVARILAGVPPRGLVGSRIFAAMREAGIPLPGPRPPPLAVVPRPANPDGRGRP